MTKMNASLNCKETVRCKNAADTNFRVVARNSNCTNASIVLVSHFLYSKK